MQIIRTDTDLRTLLDRTVDVSGNDVRLIDPARFREAVVDKLIYNAVFHPSERLKDFLAWLVHRAAAAEAIYPASLRGLYGVMGQGRVKELTIPAAGVRFLSFDAARACLRACNDTASGTFVFQIDDDETLAVSPQAYTTCVLGAAIKERYQGPIFFQTANLRRRQGTDSELGPLQDRIDEAMAHGVFNLVVDTSECMEAEQPTPAEQVQRSAAAAAELGAYIRGTEPGAAHTCLSLLVSGAEEPQMLVRQFRAATEALETELASRAGGVAGFNGSTLALHPNSDPRAMQQRCTQLAEVAHRERNMAMILEMDGSAAETLLTALPGLGIDQVNLGRLLEDHMVASEAFPADLRKEMHQWLDRQHPELRGPGQSDEDFHRRYQPLALAHMDQRLWDLPAERRKGLADAIEARLTGVLSALRAVNTMRLVLDTVALTDVAPTPPHEGYFENAETLYKDLLDQLAPRRPASETQYAPV